jgi:hypothetical protein
MVYNKESDPRTTWPFLSGSDLHEKVTRTNSQIPQTHKDEINLLQLPLDLLLEIFSWLSHGELIQMEIVCKTFLNACRHDRLWKALYFRGKKLTAGEETEHLNWRNLFLSKIWDDFELIHFFLFRFCVFLSICSSRNFDL